MSAPRGDYRPFISGRVRRVLSSGQLLDNRYRLDERIATGGMGDVWRGTDVLLGRVVAVKVLRTAMLSDPEFAARFYGEARMLAAFRHPGVVEVYDYNSASASDEDGCAYLVMAYVAGEPLSTMIKDGARLGVAETMSIVAQAADALHAAHQHGTVHRDVKPGNLMVKPNGTVVLVDFGVARSAAVTSVTGINSIVGTALYMAPEQVSKGDLSPGTDIYALGAVAYQCLAGRPPFDGDNALQVALMHLEDEPPPLPDDVPGVVRDLITRAMAKNPADRFATAAEFADAALEASDEAASAVPTSVSTPAPTVALRTASTTRTAAAPRHSSARTPTPTRRGRRLPLQLALLGLLVAVGGMAVALAWPTDETPDDGGPRGTVSEAPLVPNKVPTDLADSPSEPTSRPSRGATTSTREVTTGPSLPAPANPPPATSKSPTPSSTPTSRPADATTSVPVTPATTTAGPPLEGTQPDVQAAG
jgi:serine/threonine protein kinase